MNDNILKYLMSNPSLSMWIKELDSDLVSKVICALANTNGGCVVVGIGEDMNVVGVDEHLSVSFIDKVNESIKPLPPFSVTNAVFDEKRVLLINVWEGNNKPYTTHDAFYILTDGIIRRASYEEVSDISERTYNFSTGWERQVVPGLSINELTDTVLKRFKDALVKDRRILSNVTDIDVIRHLGFLQKQNITNAGAVMLCSAPARYLPQTRVRVSVFDKENNLCDVQLFDRCLLEIVDRIVYYVGGLYPKHIVINGLERFEEETLPIVALREGLLNAVVHRTYDRYDSFVAINIYDDCLEIVNSGSLPENMSTSDFLVSHKSILRNPDIANAFYTVKYIEMAGSGTLRIVEECKKNHCEVPSWTATDGTVTLRFNGIRHNMSLSPEKQMIDVNKLTSDSSVRNSLVRILEYMRVHENVKLADVATLLNKSYPTSKRYMRILTDSLLVEYKGNNRSGGWCLSKK